MNQRLISIISLSLLFLLIGRSEAQEGASGLSDEQFGLQHLTEYLGLKPDDIGYRPDYTEPDSFRLDVVNRLMQKPLGMIDYTDNLFKVPVKGQPEILAAVMFEDLKKVGQVARSRPYRADVSEIQQGYNLYYNDLSLNQMLTRAALYLDVIFPRSVANSLAVLTPAERKFLRNQFRELLTVDENEEFLSVEAIDSLDKVDEGYCKQFVKFGTKIDKDPPIQAGIDCLREIMLETNNIRSQLESGQISVDKLMEGLAYLPDNVDRSSYLGLQPGWKIGGTGNDYYSGDYKFILDFGGDDIYDLKTDPNHPHSTIIIDLSGNDTYHGSNDFTYGSGYFSVGLLLDFGGNDRYDGGSFSLGSGYFGFGILYDAGGDDIYNGDTHTEGAGTFGLGLLIDESGRDIYNAALYSQGFGSVEGIGVLQDDTGSDSYYAGGKYKYLLNYKDHYLSLSQGFGYGLRPWMSGGIGVILDKAGNDTYNTDIFGQATSYWWSLGIICDSSGNDNYQCFQYGQGTATHMALGVLIDNYGNDVYQGKGLMQGCGHDYSCGLILDRHGDDLYNAYDLSQGAGSANGAGVLIDNEGDDRYYVKNKANTQGYGNPRRDFGSIGLFIDLGGKDIYYGNGHDNYYWRTDSKWGGGMDIDKNQDDSAGE